jgi:hypothetical protein
MEYISTDDSEKYHIKHGALTESPIRGSTARFICNPIVDDIEAAPDPKEEYQPPGCLVVGDQSINDLASWRWQERTVGPETERELIRRIQEGDPRCRAGQPRGCSCRSCRAFFDPRLGTVSLLPAFHHSIRKIAGGYVPKRGPRQVYKRESDSLIFQELMAVGCLGLFKAALAFDFDRGYRLWTIAQPKIDGLISNEANYLRRNGMGGGKRIERWLFSHLGDTPEELLAAQEGLRLKRPVFRSLDEFAAAIKAASAVQYCDVYSDDGEDGGGDVPNTAATEPLEEFRDVYQSQDPLYWSPQLARHRNKVSAIVDFWVRELCDPPRIKARPQAKSVYKPCTVKPTGRVLHLIDTPYWMEPRDKRPKEIAGEPYDPVRREVAAIRLKNGKTKRVYRQMAASSVRRIYRKTHLTKGKSNVRSNRMQATRSPIAEIIVFQSRASGVEGFHLGQRYNPPCIGQRLTGTRVAGER